MAGAKTKAQDILQNTAKKQRGSRGNTGLEPKAKRAPNSKTNGAAPAPSTTSFSPPPSFRGNGFQPQVVRKNPLNFSLANPIFVTILIGPSHSPGTPATSVQYKFVIHLTAIYTYSSTLTKIFTSPSLDSSSTLTHTITNIAPRTFGLFVNWLYFQTFEHADKAQVSSLQYTRLWILGQEFGAPKLQNHVMMYLEPIMRQTASREGVGKLRNIFDLAYSPIGGGDKAGMTALKQLAVDTVLNFSTGGLHLQGLPEGMKSDVTAVLMSHFQGLPLEQRVPTRNAGEYLVDEREPVEGEVEGEEDGEAEIDGKHVEAKSEKNDENKESVNGIKEETATAPGEDDGFAGPAGTSGSGMEPKNSIEEVKKGGDGSGTPSWKTVEDGEDRAKDRNGEKREFADRFEKILEENLENNRKEDRDEWDAMSVDSKETPKRARQIEENGAGLYAKRE